MILKNVNLTNLEIEFGQVRMVHQCVDSESLLCVHFPQPTKARVGST